MNSVESKFQKMGARCEVRESQPLQRTTRGPVSLNVLRDRQGEYFVVSHRPDVDLEVLSVDVSDRHLVLMARDGKVKSRFLCGHDEREWFVAAIPERTPVTTVAAAKEALKPVGVASAPELPRRQRGKRRTSAYKRQGEWFFVPRPDFQPDGGILRNEIITRSGRGGGGKPHVCAEMVRSGGSVVYRVGTEWLETDLWVAAGSPRFLSRQVSGATVYVRGAIRHPDHKTLNLSGWHQVLMNTEQSARAMSHVAFID